MRALFWPMDPLPPAPRAALMLIGDELLSGKIRDENGVVLAKLLRDRGADLVEMATIPDCVQGIALTLRRLSARATWIFCSGGVGPTHDDKTMEGVALGLGQPLARHEGLAARLLAHYGDKASPEAMRMADLPAGATLYGAEPWPVTGVPYAVAPGSQEESLPTLGPGDTHRVYILPGIPALFARKLEGLAEDELPTGPRWERHELELLGDESRFAATLRDIAAAFPQVAIGSYPQWEKDPRGKLKVRVRLTFESRSPGQALRARDAMAKQSPSAPASC